MSILEESIFIYQCSLMLYSDHIRYSSRDACDSTNVVLIPSTGAHIYSHHCCGEKRTPLLMYLLLRTNSSSMSTKGNCHARISRDSEGSREAIDRKEELQRKDAKSLIAAR